MSNTNIIFNKNGLETTIQCKEDECLRDVCARYSSKENIQIDQFLFLHGGITLDLNIKVNQINSHNSQIKIVVISSNNSENTVSANKESKHIICPTCQTDCTMNISDYKVECYNCENGHKSLNMQIKKLNESQSIDESKIKCNRCENVKSLTFNKQFFKCFNCNVNLCPMCMSQHDKTHNIIDYDFISFKCHIHKDEKYISYCTKCCTNLCMLCGPSHKDHKIISYEELLVNKDNFNLTELNSKITQFSLEAKNIIDKLNNVIENLEAYKNIVNRLYNSYDLNRNFQTLSTFGNIFQYNNKILSDINTILSQPNMTSKFQSIINIYNKMYNIQPQSNINFNNNINNNNINFNNNFNINNYNNYYQNVIEKEYPEGKYSGEMKNGLRHGYGTFNYYKNKKNERKRYEGEWKDDKINGKGTMEWFDGGKYIGFWENDLKDGKGMYFYPNGNKFGRKKYEGDWEKGQKEGKGRMEWEDGGVYDGDWTDDKKDGKGVYYYPNGDRYEGGFINDQKEGDGVWYYYGGDRELLKFRNGYEYGNGVKLRRNGKIEKTRY